MRGISWVAEELSAAPWSFSVCQIRQSWERGFTRTGLRNVQGEKTFNSFLSFFFHSFALTFLVSAFVQPLFRLDSILTAARGAVNVAVCGPITLYRISNCGRHSAEWATCHGATSLFRKEITFTVGHAFVTWWRCELLIREKRLRDWLIGWLIGRLVKFTGTSSRACGGVVTHRNKCRQ